MTNDSAREHLRSLSQLSPEEAEIRSFDWETLLLTLRENQALILRHIYDPPKPTAFKEIYFSLQRIGQSKRTARRAIAELRNIGLIEVVHSIIGVAYPIPGLVPCVQRLLKLWQKKREGFYPSSITSWEEVARLVKERKYTSNNQGDGPC